MPFSLDNNPSPSEISEAINYLLNNFTANVYADDVSGQIFGPTGNVVAYLYKYLAVKYADSFDGTLNFSNSPTNRLYYGLRNSDIVTEPSSPSDYVWYEVTGGFGTTKLFWYSVTGGRQVQTQISVTKPADGYIEETGPAIDLDNITAPSFSSATYVIYRVANDSSAPTNAESQAALNRNPIENDIATINYNAGSQSIQYRYDGTTWNVLNKYITGDIIKNLEGLDCAISVVTREDFKTTIANPSHLEGRLFYDNTEHALSYYNEASGITVNLGREQLVRIYNNLGSALNAGQMVYINGASSGWPTVALAQANTSILSQSTIGMVVTNISNLNYGYVCVAGVVNGLNTSSFTAGQQLYLSATTPGGITGTVPIQPNYDVEIGTVLFSNATTGSIYIHVDKHDWYPSLRVINTTASVALPTTPTLFVLPTVVVNDGFVYNTTTGEVTLDTSGTYTLIMTLNCTPSAANKNIYAYFEYDIGSGWTIDQYSARQQTLFNNATEQIVLTESSYFRAGTKLRFYIWSDATVDLETVDLPGTTPGTVTIAAAQFSIA